MRLFWSCATMLVNIFGVMSASTLPARVLVQSMSDGHAPPTPFDLSTTIAIFAESLGLSQLYTLAPQDPDSILAVDRFAKSPAKLFGNNEERSRGSLIIVEGVLDPGGTELAAELFSVPFFSITSSPSSKSNAELLNILNEQATYLSSSQTKPYLSTNTALFEEFKDLPGIYEPSSQAINGGSLLHVTTLENAGKISGVRSEAYSSAQNSVIKGLQHAQDYAYKHDIHLMIALMPFQATHETTWPEELLVVPSQHARRPLSRRSDPDSSSFAESQASKNIFQRDEERIIHGILPSCFRSMEICEQETKNCTGRGECKQIYEDKEGDKSCFRCACKAKEVKDENGNIIKRTGYGGPACQKRDISFQFWLIAGFSIAMIFLISWGVGLLYSIGQEELPSVLGAGVPGAKSR